ncbi:MAG: DUF1295 domain-containing protein [Cyclobacteriaceae bacterium]
MNTIEIWLYGLLISMLFLTVLWIVSVYLKNASIIDPFWGTGFIILMTYYLNSTENFSERSIMVSILLAIWGLRLSVFLLIRNRGHGEDFRYKQFRREYGPDRYWWISFFQVFLLQGVLMSIVALPMLAITMGDGDQGLTLLDFAAGLIWSIGMTFEAGGDYQLALFKKNNTDKDKVLNTGLWKYTRHPNYFGDALVWWSYGLFGLISGSYLCLLGPLLMTLLLIKVSGVSLLEKTLKSSKPKYQEYIEKTNAFFPWFPKS